MLGFGRKRRLKEPVSVGSATRRIERNMRRKLRGLTAKEVWEVMHGIDDVLDEIEESLEDRNKNEIYR